MVLTAAHADGEDLVKETHYTLVRLFYREDVVGPPLPL